MRKTLIALILVLPMVFVLVIFSSVNLVSLGVDISVNGITVRSEGMDEEGTLFLDMADKKVHIVTAEVSPANATEQGYTLSSSDESVASLSDGRIVPKKEGTVTITAKSNDKSFTDSMSVVIVSSKPYDFDFSLLKNGEDLLKGTEDGYEADISAGVYPYEMSIQPMGFSDYSLEVTNGEYAEVRRSARELYLPFSGKNTLELSVEGGVNGKITKSVSLNVTRPAEGEVVINGETNPSAIRLVEGTRETRLYLESYGNFGSFTSDHARLKGTPTRIGSGKYILDVEIDEDAPESFQATVIAGGKAVHLNLTFEEFAFSVFSDMPVTPTEEGGTAVLLTGNAVKFYAVASGVEDVTFSWEMKGAHSEYLTVSEDGGTATVKAIEGGEYTLIARAVYGGKTYEKTIVLSVVSRISAIQIKNNTKVDLAERYTVAGKEYGEDFTLKDYVYPLRVYAYSTAGTALAKEEDVGYSVSDESIARVELRNGTRVLVPVGTGAVTVTAYWKGNASFGSEVEHTLDLNVVKDAVAVKNSPELVRAAEDGKEIVLTEDIKLGTDQNGTPYSLDRRNQILASHTMRSTYNIAWYEETAEDLKPEVHYAIEFTNNVYGNGRAIDADYFTHAHDSTGKPLLENYKGPLCFVKYKQMASVAGQDNCAFLIRTDGVTLYGVNLLGCSDTSLAGENGYDLTNLNLTGTTLEVNASVDLINCRIRNGRNVIRAYGGNRTGDKYFIEALSQNQGCDGERITVNIRGCILSQGREFILKLGANKALRASNANGREPVFIDQSGKPYPEVRQNGSSTSNNYTTQSGGSLLEDAWFYQKYVMTDVTLEDSVIETSGLFTVGIESNFAGSFLYEGSDPKSNYYAFTKEWQKSGGTSFASVLRLKGDVRLYDWKDISLIDSSTLIESPMGELNAWLKLDIKSMIDFVSGKYPDDYGSLVERSEEKEYVHGGIALYGGGRNYSCVDYSELKENLKNLLHLNVNISILKDGGGTMQQQGTLLPSAAGTQDFNFYMYGSNGANNYSAQKTEEQQGKKYDGVIALPRFPVQ